jgi:hypothetical protein
MTPHSIIIDDFLPDFDGWREWADTAKYDPIENPVDGVVYPGICTAIPSFGTQQRLSLVMGTNVKVRTLFMRLSLEGIAVPHQAHTDAVMGEFSLMLYLNRAEHCRGGTSLVRHVSGMDSHPTTPEQVALWEQDTNAPDRWSIYSMAEMKPNRAFIFRSDLFHRAEPIGGFGAGPTNGRLVLTAFFDL